MKLAEEKGVSLHELPLAAMQGVEGRIDQRVFEVLDVESSVRSRKSYGGTAPENVAAAVASAREGLK